MKRRNQGDSDPVIDEATEAFHEAADAVTGVTDAVNETADSMNEAAEATDEVTEDAEQPGPDLFTRVAALEAEQATMKRAIAARLDSPDMFD